MSHIAITQERGVATIALNRPEVRNAFDDKLIRELTIALVDLDREPNVRAVVITGSGPAFSAGADLGWMRRMAAASEEENRIDAQRLAELMRTLAFLGKTTLARVNGSAFGGGVGLVACCDIAIGVESATFGLTETRLGLVPAAISPYVIDAVGARQALRWFQTAEIFDARRAQTLGLLHEVVPADALDTAVAAQLALLREAAPLAVREAKALALRVAGRGIDRRRLLDEENAALIARLRVSAEGQEGLDAFLDKRRPAWIATDEPSA